MPVRSLTGRTLTRPRQRGARSVSGEKLDVEREQIPREIRDPIAIRDREQGSHDLLQSLSVELARGSGMSAARPAEYSNGP